MQERFRECVVDDFTRTYIEGKTPNPCVRCNEKMRVSDFYMRVRASLEEEGTIDTATPLFLSTGHYARIVYTSDGPFLKRARDSSKDQSYMLYRISKAMLPNLVFPLGEYTKKEVVGLARELDFPQASVRESQDVCFIDGEYGEFVKQYGGAPADVGPGEIVDSSGTVLGKHKGYIYYTVGQRRGLDLSNGPWYVKEIDPYRNRVVVGRRAETLRERFRIEETNWFIEPSAFPLECEVKIRYNTPPVRGHVELDGEQGGMITLATPCVITRGQSAVCYRDGLVLGGGIIA
jgi:tRNA-specific 2-thiouridylase